MINVYIGISGSGKTTLCKQDMKLDDNSVRVNRDDLRMAVYGLDSSTYKSYFSREDLYQCEQFITDLEGRIISRAISKGKNVYADNTHLKQKYIKRYYAYDTFVNLIWIDSDVDLAIHRDLNRDITVGEEVIRRQFNSYNILKKEWKEPAAKQSDRINNDITKKWCYVFDIDGTLAEKCDRSPYDYSRVKEDNIRHDVFETLNAIRDYGAERIIICSGRDSVCLPETKEWLDGYGVYYDEIYLRNEGDVRADWRVKEEMWRKICEDNYIVAMFDDRNQVVDHARSLGFNVYQVNYGDF